MPDRTMDDYRNFVCSTCFQQLPECNCRFFPWNLIFIDVGMQEAVRIFNKKGYITNGCCEGHYDAEHGESVYVSFVVDYPEIIGRIDMFSLSYIKSKHSIGKLFSPNVKEEKFLATKQKMLANIIALANDLPSLRS